MISDRTDCAERRLNLETISVVVPVYNNQLTLEETCLQILEVHRSSFQDLKLEIIFVNDGSTDQSWEELLRLQSIHKDHICLLNLSRNFGQLGALLAGLDHANGSAVICVSADLQDPIQLMAKMVAYWKNNTEIVICYRENRTDGFLNRAFSALAYRIARISYSELPKGGFDYWLMSSMVCRLLRSFKGRNIFLQGYLSAMGFSRAFIPYTRVRRKVGKSGYTFRGKVSAVVELIVTTHFPIRLMSFVGAITSLSGVTYSILITYGWFWNETPFSGWAPLMIVSMTIGGVIMVMLGIIGEYVWRIYDHLRDFPRYVVETTSKLGRDDNVKKS
jgi:polyisoprenyl-phosphate glycosyltransferase